MERQKYVSRIKLLKRMPEHITKFVSAEPLIDELDIRQWLIDGTLNWVIAGGESGPGARPMQQQWARYLREQCKASDVPYFLKQLGGARDKRGGELVLQRRFLHLVTFGQFLAGNRFAEGKTTKLSSAWAGRHEEVLKGPFLRTVVVILAVLDGVRHTEFPATPVPGMGTIE